MPRRWACALVQRYELQCKANTEFRAGMKDVA